MTFNKDGEDKSVTANQPASNQEPLISETKYRSILNNIPGMAYRANPDWTIEFISNSELLCGYSNEELQTEATSWLNIIHPDDKSKILEESALLNQKSLSLSQQYRIYHKNGKIRWVSDHKQSLFNDGRFAGVDGIVFDITDRIEAEGALEIHKERLRRGQIFANIGTWDWNIQTGELFWSERIGPLFGYAEGELETSYDNFLNAVHPDDRQSVIDAVNNCVTNNAPYDIEHRVAWPDGTVRWLHERGAVVRDDKGIPLHMLGVVQDIHDRKLAEQSLQESKAILSENEEKFRGLYELSPVGIALNDMEGTFIEANQSFLDIIGYTEDECRKLTYWELTPEEYATEEAKQLENLTSTGRYGPYEKTYLHKDGHRVPVLLNGTLVTDRDGNVRIWSIVQDISKRKKDEEALKIFRRIFDSTAQGIGVTDAEGNIIYTNKAHDIIHDCVYEEIYGKHFRQFFSEETLSWAPDAIMEQISQGNSWSGLLPVLRPDGTEVITSANVGFIANDNGAPEYMFNIMSDYSEEQKRQYQLREAKEIAENANRAKSEFLSSMSHELRTPMNAILGFGQLLQLDDDLPEDHRDNVQEIISAGKHLLELINQVLDLAKVESGQIELSLEPVSICHVIDECISLIAPLALKHNIEIIPSCLEGIAVRADRTRLKQAVINLLSNAIKYNRDGGKVSIYAEHANDRIRILVKDTGIGISENKVNQLFKPFNRLDAEGSNIEGTGIGLSITYQILELMGGSIGVETEHGIGSTFWIELPLEENRSSELAESITDADNQDYANSADTVTILYIEDNPANLKLVAQILGRRQNIKLLTAHSPLVGLELALSRQPDLILLDINMPEMNGYQVLDIIRSNSTFKNVPVIAVTANAMDKDIKRGEQAGFDAYVTKPIDVVSFLSVIDGFLVDRDTL